MRGFSSGTQGQVGTQDSPGSQSTRILGVDYPVCRQACTNQCVDLVPLTFLGLSQHLLTLGPWLGLGLQ